MANDVATLAYNAILLFYRSILAVVAELDVVNSIGVNFGFLWSARMTFYTLCILGSFSNVRLMTAARRVAKFALHLMTIATSILLIIDAVLAMTIGTDSGRRIL